LPIYAETIPKSFLKINTFETQLTNYPRKIASQILDNINSILETESSKENKFTAIDLYFPHLKNSTPINKQKPKIYYKTTEEVLKLNLNNPEEYLLAYKKLVKLKNYEFKNFLQNLDLLRRNDSKNFHKQLQNLMYLRANPKIVTELSVKDQNGNEELITDKQEINKSLTSKYSELFLSDSHIYSDTEDLHLHEVTQEEVEEAITTINIKKAISNDCIPGEILKIPGAGKIIQTLLNLFLKLRKLPEMTTISKLIPFNKNKDGPADLNSLRNYTQKTKRPLLLQQTIR